MPVISHIDGPNRRIYLHSDTVSVGLTSFDAFYREYRSFRELNANLQLFNSFISAGGNLPKGGGKFTPRFIKELLGCRIVPYNTSHVLIVTFEILTDDGQSGTACFDRSPLALTSRVDIDYQPQAFEVVKVSSGSGLDESEHAKLMGLSNSSLTVSQSNQLTSIDDIVQQLQNTQLTLQRFKELSFNRQSTIVNANRKIAQIIAGGDTTVNMTYDTNDVKGVCISQAIEE